jgi:hypothetical protein
LKAAEQKEEAITNKIYNSNDFLKRAEIRKEHEKEIVKTSEKINDLKITIKLLKNNARVALFNDIKTIIAESFNNYNGKPYGEKTRSKIAEEIKEKTGCRCYIYAEYLHSQRIEVYTGSNDYNITIGYPGNSENKFLIDNKIQLVEPEQLQLYYIKNTYFDDIPKAIKEMKKAYKKAVEKQKELEKMCDDFNFYAVDGIERIYKDKYISPTFRG